MQLKADENQEMLVAMISKMGQVHSNNYNASQGNGEYLNLRTTRAESWRSNTRIVGGISPIHFESMVAYAQQRGSSWVMGGFREQGFIRVMGMKLEVQLNLAQLCMERSMVHFFNSLITNEFDLTWNNLSMICLKGIENLVRVMCSGQLQHSSKARILMTYRSLRGWWLRLGVSWRAVFRIILFRDWGQRFKEGAEYAHWVLACNWWSHQTYQEWATRWKTK